MTSQTRPLFLRSLQQLQDAFWLRRIALWIVRAAWLSLLIPTVVMAGYLWLGWRVPWYEWLVPMMLVGCLSLLWSVRPVSLKRIVPRLDRRLDLQTRLITAFEVSRDKNLVAQAENPVIEGLYTETEHILTTLRRGVHLINRALWLEVQALIAVLALLGALLLLDALSPRLPEMPAVDLPPVWQEPTADQLNQKGPALAQSIAPENVKTDPLDKENFQDALKILADEFRDHAVTRAIAESIDRRDLHQAAEGVRRLADQLDALSPEGRAELGGSMQSAAVKIGSMAPSITEPLQVGSQALAKDDLLLAGRALEELARVLDEVQDDPAQTAEYKPVDQQQVPAQQSQLSPQEDSQNDNPNDNPPPTPTPPAEEERLDAESKPLELESEQKDQEKVVQAGDPNAQAAKEQTEDTPFTRQPLQTSNQELGRDPLVYPWEQREVIRRYFTP